jgi:circadian clock protein KaiB
VKTYQFTLYLAGTSPRSGAALENFRRLCDERLQVDGYDITVVDVLSALDDVEAARILVTPTIIRTHPLPTIRVIGDLSATRKLADALGMPDLGKPAS